MFEKNVSTLRLTKFIRNTFLFLSRCLYFISFKEKEKNIAKYYRNWYKKEEYVVRYCYIIHKITPFLQILTLPHRSEIPPPFI